MRSITRFLVLLAWLPMAARAAPADIPTQAQALLERSTTPEGTGAVMLIARGDQVVWQGARGQAQIELGVPMTPDKVMSVASVTKMLTAATVLKLRDDGKLSLDDPLAKYLPAFPGGEAITLRQLLHHSAGVSDRAVKPVPGLLRQEQDTATQVAQIAERPANFPPGTRFAYSNAGYILLGAVIEAVTGQPWHEAVKAQVITPLGLTHTLFGADAPLVPGRAAGYIRDPVTGVVRNGEYINLTGPAAAGGFLSTADDLRLWIRAVATGRLLKPESVREMFSAGPPLPGESPENRYGLGVYLWSVRGEPMIGHTGQINGFTAVVGYLPARDLTVVALFNDYSADARNQGRRLAAIALGQPYEEPVAAPVSAQALASLAGRYQDGAGVRTLLVQDGALFVQRGERPPYPLTVTASGRLHFKPDELSYFLPVRGPSGAVTRLDYYPGGDGPPRPMPRLP
ncbi:serine hydrolase [Caulobacter sp. SLTY]|uniref:serine hydrolase domain-containing protein n=1 Tax=Caulobacter sp. SLTY TaxID=2683262 RepID=UPI0014130F19|nr:serine hydrolase domain-containing protein [Caulobacter sp. SLTY]NBB13853.1 serine hydrolase [Caulobacter sp. SLTY]